ncbi:MAG: ATP-binding cassette domain-containing protein, partial [Pseudomonadota bacterium]
MQPDNGSLTLGATLSLVSLDQRRASLNNDMRVADAITDGRGDWVSINGQKKHAAAYLKDYLFGPEQWRAPVSSLSGGERGRLALAAALAKPSSLLLLDEPTNDLDLETLDVLIETIDDYAGTLILISHDRDFLNKTVTSTIAPGPSEGEWIEYVGGYDDLIAQGGLSHFNRASDGEEKPKSNASPPIAKQKHRDQKLSFKEKHALETLPGEIEALENDLAKLDERLNDPALFERDPEEFKKTAERHKETQTRLSEAEDQWLTLEAKREALEGA